MNLAQTGNLIEKDVAQLNAWAKKNVPLLKTTLCKCFNKVQCPFKLSVLLLRSSADKKHPKTLCTQIVDVLKKWKADHKGVEVPMSEKRALITLLGNFNKTNSNQLLALFELDKPDLSLLNDYFEKCLQDKRYEKVVYFIQALNLHNESYTKDLIIPLLVNNEICLVEEYMADCVPAQRHILPLLDSWIGNGIEFGVYPEISAAFSNKKQMTKLLTRWVEKFKETCSDLNLPYLTQNKVLGQIRFFFHRYYKERSISAQAVEELVVKYINGNMELARKVFRMIAREFRDCESADRLQQRLETSQTSNQIFDVWATDEEYDESNFLQLGVPLSAVLFVDSLDKLKVCSDHVFNVVGEVQLKPIGFDCEWTTAINNDPMLALVQIATGEKVFLIDVCYFRNTKQMPVLDSFIGRLFTSDSLLKLGFGIRTDLQLLRQEFPSFPQQAHYLLDLIDVRSMPVKYGLLPAADGIKYDVLGLKIAGLNKMVSDTLDISMDKREQISDWERRPLRPAQVKYASIDAHCLIQVHQVLCKRLSRSGVANGRPLHELTRSHQSIQDEERKKLKKEKQENKKSKEVKTEVEQAPDELPVSKPVWAKDLLVLCDVMFAGLCKSLRNIGVDTILREPHQTVDECVELASKDNRWIFSSGNSYERFCIRYGRDRCTHLASNVPRKQQLIDVMNLFDIRITKGDLFSRCQVCNADKFVVIGNPDIRRILARRSQLQSAHDKGIPPEPCKDQLRSLPVDKADGKLVDNSVYLRLDDMKIVSDFPEQIAPVALDSFQPLSPDREGRLTFICPKCGKFYWQGSHYSQIQVSLKPFICNN